MKMFGVFVIRFSSILNSLKDASLLVISFLSFFFDVNFRNV